MAILKHELWREQGGEEAGSHFEAMTKYWQHMGWGEYTTNHDWDRQPYPEEWLET